MLLWSFSEKKGANVSYNAYTTGKWFIIIYNIIVYYNAGKFQIKHC